MVLGEHIGARPSRLGIYDLDGSMIATARQSKVYRGRRSDRASEYAIKVYAPGYSHVSFDNETTVHRNLSGEDNILPFRGQGRIRVMRQGQPVVSQYLVTDKANESLWDKTDREGALSASDAADIISQTANGLMSVHRRGLVHTDVKPGNILLTDNGTVWLADFGQVGNSPKGLTSEDRFKFTAQYAAPEQLEGFASEPTDTYALGLMSYLFATGEEFFNVTDESRFYLHDPLMYELFKRDKLRDIKPKPLRDLFYSTFHVDPDQRPETPQRFAEEFALVA